MINPDDILGINEPFDEAVFKECLAKCDERQAYLMRVQVQVLREKGPMTYRELDAEVVKRLNEAAKRLN